MMRALLFLCLIGAAIYGFLVFTEDALKETDSKDRVAIQTQQSRSSGERLSRLCVRGQQGDWTVQLAADQRSASVHAASCTDLPWLLSQVTLRGE